MSYAETPPETLRKFAQNDKWSHSSADVIAADFFSINSETNLFLNPAYYEEHEGRLFDPVRKRNVAGTAGADIIEEGVISQIEKWFLSKDSGIAVWISPRGGNMRPYPEEQITIYRIAYTFEGQKILLFTSHQFKHKFKNPEEIRKFIFTEEDSEDSVLSILGWLKEVSDKPVQTNLQDVEKRKSLAKHYAYQYTNGVPIERIIYEMTISGFLGENPIGCGASRIALTNTTTTPLWEYYSNMTDYAEASFPCPRCQGPIPSGFGITTCPHCGLTKEQAGSTCG